METLWAPWRLDYLDTKDTVVGCVFCTLPTQTNDKDNLILWRGDHSFVIMNRYPYNSGHLMVVINKHTDSLHGLAKGEQAELIWATGECIRILKEVLGAHASNSGMNLGQDAGAGIVGHLHMHVVPRWRGDSNFFPIIADTKSLPEYLAKTYEKLHPAFQQLKK
jgi:ATP adenylyltransferase